MFARHLHWASGSGIGYSVEYTQQRRARIAYVTQYVYVYKYAMHGVTHGNMAKKGLRMVLRSSPATTYDVHVQAKLMSIDGESGEGR